MKSPNAFSEAYVHAHADATPYISGHTLEEMGSNQLRLLILSGPQVVKGEVACDLRPPVVVHLLLTLSSAYPGNVARHVLANQLFGHVQAAHRRTHLRSVILKAQATLQESGFDLAILTEGDSVKLNLQLPCDAIEVQTGTLIPIGRLKAYSEGALPASKGRHADIIRSQVRRIIEQSLPAIMKSVKSVEQVRDLSTTLLRMRRLYPTSFVVAASCCAALNVLLLHEQALSESVDFEECWINEFGTASLPNLEAHSSEIAKGLPRP